MIRVSGETITPTQFPDGSLLVKWYQKKEHYILSWHYENDAELLLLMYLVGHIRAKNPQGKIILEMPYVPNARMDRTKQEEEVFTLKYFADFINEMRFDRVNVLDPHSNVSKALLNRVHEMDVTKYIKNTLDDLKEKGMAPVVHCYPDEGAMKRYSEMFSAEYVFGIKHRDWATGKIERLEITNPQKVNGRNVLIIDDICSRGGTFTHTARALKEAGAENIFLYITHCERAIFKGDVLKDGLISHVYTTNSIFNAEHEKITVFHI